MIKTYTTEDGKYEQGFDVQKEVGLFVISDAWCTCRWSTINRDAWASGKKLCKHLSAKIRELKIGNLNEKSDEI